MIIKSKMRALLAGALFCAAGIVTVQAANSSLITFSVDLTTNNVLGTFVPGVDTVSVHGTFTGDNFGTAVPLVQNTALMPEIVYTNTYNDTAEKNGTNTMYKFVIDGSTWETTADFHNRMATLPSTSGASLVLPTPFFADNGGSVTQYVTFQVDMTQQIKLGYFTPPSTVTNYITAAGNFNGWDNGYTGDANTRILTNNPNILITNLPSGIVTSNVYQNTFQVVASPNAQMDFKYLIIQTNLPSSGAGVNWEGPNPANLDDGQNRFFTSFSQALPLVFFSDAPYAPFCTNVFSVDMSAPAAFDATYDPTTVTLNGSFNGWGAAIPMTNNMNAANTNLFTTALPVIVGQGQTIFYQFRYTDSGGLVYDHAPNGQNRQLVEPLAYNYTVPSVYFNNQDASDYLKQSVNVTFTIDMTGAVGTDSSIWSPGTAVYVNGPWPNWQGWDPISLASQALTEVGSTPIYSGTFTIPAGISTSLTYKYGMGSGTSVDNEAAQDQNLIRVIRTTSTGAYTFPQDKWANMYQEPSFGQLAVTPAAGGKVALSWLGRQACQVQTSTSLSSPSWVSLPLTDGTNWTVGAVSTNGLVSATNYPASTGNLFFRLIKY